MSKALGLSRQKASINPAASSMLNELKKIDTSTVDSVNEILANNAYALSQTLENRPDYVYNVEASDNARQRMEDAVYNSYLEKLVPQFAAQAEDLDTKLQNQGLSIGSEAYQRAMGSLQGSYNSALNQAAYQSVLAGQNAYSNSLNDSISAANFNNSARMLPVSEILSLISNSPTEFDILQTKYKVGNNAYNDLYERRRQYQNDQSERLNQTMNTLGKVGSAFLVSDERLKENLQKVGKLNNGLDVYLFNYKHDKTPRIGLIAQEVQAINPEAVIEDENGYLHIRYDLAVK